MEKGWFVALILALFCSSCYNDSEERLYPQSVNCQVENVSYQKDVLPILETSCYRCHNETNYKSLANSNLLEGYENIFKYAENGKLIHVIKHDAGYPAMPRNASKLSPCQQNTIEVWVKEGILNN